MICFNYRILLHNFFQSLPWTVTAPPRSFSLGVSGTHTMPGWWISIPLVGHLGRGNGRLFAHSEAPAVETLILYFQSTDQSTIHPRSWGKCIHWNKQHDKVAEKFSLLNNEQIVYIQLLACCRVLTLFPYPMGGWCGDQSTHAQPIWMPSDMWG